MNSLARKLESAAAQLRKWDESAHPRDDDGKFGSGGGDAQWSSDFKAARQAFDQGKVTYKGKSASEWSDEYNAKDKAHQASLPSKNAARMKQAGFDPKGHPLKRETAKEWKAKQPKPQTVVRNKDGSWTALATKKSDTIAALAAQLRK